MTASWERLLGLRNQWIHWLPFLKMATTMFHSTCLREMSHSQSLVNSSGTAILVEMMSLITFIAANMACLAQFPFLAQWRQQDLGQASGHLNLGATCMRQP